MGSEVSIGTYRLGRLDGGWCVYWRDGGKRRRFRLDAGTAQEARGALAVFAARHARLNAEHTGTLGDIFAAYVKSREMIGKPVTNQGWSWKALAPHFAACKIIERYAETKGAGERKFLGLGLELTPEHVEAFIAARTNAGRSVGTIWTELTVLRMIIAWAVKDGKIGHAPPIQIPAKPEPKDRHLTRDEAHRLLDAATMPHIKLFIVMGLTTAGRMGAILDLTWDRVDLERGVIRLYDPSRERNRKGRATVPITTMARAALTEAKPGALTDYVIEWNARRCASIRKGFDVTAAKAGLPDVTPHVLRHTAAIWMAEAGVPMDEIAQYLGHTTSSITFKIYARFSPGYLAKAGEALNLAPVRPVLRSA